MSAAHSEMDNPGSFASSDVESQTSNSETEWVGTTMKPAAVKLWKEKIGTIPIGPSGHFNPHGMLAAQRYSAERLACGLLLKNEDALVFDVGAAPHRTHSHLRHRGRYMMPSIVASDKSRWWKVPDAVTKDQVCRHAFEECTCWAGEDNVAFLFTHSAYYVDPSSLVEVLLDPRVVDAIVVEHTFDDAFGGFYGEASWHIEKDVVKMTVSGNSQPYVHRLPAWQSGWIGAGGVALHAETLHSLDTVTRIARLTVVTVVGEPARSLTWDQVEADPTRSGPLQFSSATRNATADNARFTGVTFDVHQVKKCGPVLYTDFVLKGETVCLTVPVNAVSQVALHVVNRPRTPELYAEVTYVVRNRYSRARIPPSRLAQTVAATVALGFVVNLQNEVNLTYSMTRKFTSMMKVHAVLLQFGAMTVRRWPTLLCICVLVSLPFIAWAVVDKDDPQREMAIGLALMVPVLCFGCVCVSLRVRQSFRDDAEAGWVSSISDPESPTAPLLGHGYVLTRRLPLPGSRHTREFPDVLQGKISLGASRERETEPERSIVSGAVLDGVLPTALATTQVAEESAVRNRVVAERANPEEEQLEAYKQAFDWSVFDLKVPVDTSQAALKPWLTKLELTYPKAYVENLRNTWLQNQGIEAKPVATKGFLKIEKSASTVGVEPSKAVKPRLIQPPEDIDKAVTGPVVWQLWKGIRKLWDGVRTPILYASGYTGAYIGSVVDTFLDKYDNDVVCWSADQGSYDATLCYDLQMPVFEWYCRLGMPRWMISWLLRVRSRGTTPNAVTYCPTREYLFEEERAARDAAAMWKARNFRVKGPTKGLDPDTGGYVWMIEVEDFQMTSGRMDTNLTDSVALVAAFGMVLKTLDVPFLLLVCGDDGALFLRRQDEPLVARLVAAQRGLGLKPSGPVSAERARWEFCSKLFWFGTDSQGRVRTVMGSKPFRGIARMGVNTTLAGAANAAASALSVRIDSGHVPFLGPFADRTYELCREKKIRPIGKPEWSAIRGDVRFGPSDLNYVITAARYGLGKENEDEFKRLLATLNTVPVVLAYPPGLDAVKVDEE